MHKLLQSKGYNVESGINWTWTFLPSMSKARAFIRLCDMNGIEHRGIYPAELGHTGQVLYPVRFR